MTVGKYTYICHLIGLGKSCKFCFDSKIWREVFSSPEQIVFLEKGFRQNDNKFLQILNELRIGYVSPDTDQILNQKVREYQFTLYEKSKQNNNLNMIPSKKNRSLIHPTKLYSTNNSVDTYNKTELEKIKSPPHFYEAIDEGSEQFLNTLKNGMKAPDILELKIGCQVS